MAPERFRADEFPPEDVVAACEALSFAGVRLVLVEGADAWKADGVGALLDYLGAPNPGTCLALVAAGQLTPKLHAAIAAVGGELRYGPDPKAKGRERTQWLVEHFRKEVQRAGGSASAAVARAVVERVVVDRPDARRGGITTMELAREAEKLAAYADGEPITQEMVEALVPPHPDAKAYELADAIVRADAARVLRPPPGPGDRRGSHRPDRDPGPADEPVPLAGAGAGHRPRPVTRRGGRRDRREGLPRPHPGRAGARASRPARRSGRWRGWRRSSSTCGCRSWRGSAAPVTTGSGWCWRPRCAISSG